MKVNVSGKKLREERGSQLMTQGDLARSSHVSVPTIERLERDRKGKGISVRPVTLFALAEALDVDPRDLLVEGRSRPLGELGSPLDRARFQAARLERREKEAKSEGRLDKFWLQQWGAAEKGVAHTAKLLRQFDGDPVQRSEALDLLDRFIALEQRAEEAYFDLHGWKAPGDVLAEEPLEAESRETIETNA